MACTMVMKSEMKKMIKLRMYFGHKEKDEKGKKKWHLGMGLQHLVG